VTVDELLRRAAACRGCGKEHTYRWTGPDQASWAAPDCREYRPVLDIGTVAKLRCLATGVYRDPWLPAGPRPEVPSATILLNQEMRP